MLVKKYHPQLLELIVIIENTLSQWNIYIVHSRIICSLGTLTIWKSVWLAKRWTEQPSGPWLSSWCVWHTAACCISFTPCACVYNKQSCPHNSNEVKHRYVCAGCQQAVVCSYYPRIKCKYIIFQNWDISSSYDKMSLHFLFLLFEVEYYTKCWGHYVWSFVIIDYILLSCKLQCTIVVVI